MKYIQLFMLLTLLQGCLPSPYFSYYEPSYPDPMASVNRQWCRGAAGPPTNLSFKIAKNISMTANAAKDYYQRKSKDVPLNITMKIPLGTKIEFLSDEVIVSEEKNADGKKVKAMVTVVAAHSTINPLDLVDISRIGPVRSDLTGKAGFDRQKQLLSTAEIYFDVDATDFLPESLTVDFPAIIAGGVVTKIAPVELHLDRKATGWRIEYESNAHSRLRKEKYAQCLKMGQGGHCQSILENITEGFIESTPEYKVYGSIIFKGDNQKPVLSNSMKFKFTDVQPWRFASDMITLKDDHSEVIRLHQVNRFNLVFNWYDIPLPTPIQGVGSQPEDSTYIRILANLGEKTPPRFYVTLPPVLVDGEEFKFEPIEFIYKPVVGGIDPFNC